MPTLATIGVYGFTGATFVATLHAGDVRLVLDVRQRRGVRGPQYAWANARRLQDLLAAAGIGYHHHRELAPTTALRQRQYAADATQGVGKRNRQVLSPDYVDGYTAEILDPAPLDAVLAELPASGRAALLCVETLAAACHRSLIARRLAERHGLDVIDLMPPEPAL